MSNRFYLFFLACVAMSAQVWGQEIDHARGSFKFIENGGQWPQGVLYRADLPAGKMWLEKTGVLYQFIDASGPERIHHENSQDLNDTLIRQHLLYAEFVGASVNFRNEHHYQSSEYYNFFLGNDPQKWASKMHGYGHVTYKEIYSGIDLLYFEKNHDLKYEFHVQPNANPGQIKTNYQGADKIEIFENGSLVIETPIGKLTEEKPYAYQIKNGKIIEVSCNFVLSNQNEVSFILGEYDPSLELVIDPVLIFATYNGADSDNFGMSATYGYDGTAYSGGTIYGNSYPMAGPAWDSSPNFSQLNADANSALAYGVTDVFISKYSSDGTALLWTNFIGGGTDMQGTETVHSLICDTLNNLYLYGATSSTDFPLMNAYQSTHAGGTPNSNYFFNGVYYQTQGTDIYVTKLSEDGTVLMGSTYVGGSGNDGINYRIGGGIYNSVASYDSLTTNYGDQFRGEIMLDSINNVIVASSTRSTNFPTLNSFQPALAGQQDGLVFKLAANFSSLIWSTYFGGTSNDACYSVKIDSSYNVLIAGGTSSNNLLGTLGALNPNYMGGKTDGFVAKISPDGSTLVRTSYIGTATYDQAVILEIDRDDNVYLFGVSNGAMPVINAAYSNPNSGQFIQKLIPDLSALDYSTVFGNGNGVPNISPSAFYVDRCGNVYLSGWGANILGAAPLNGMPTTADAFQINPANGFDFYLFVMERDAADILYGSYLGGASAQEHVDGGTSRFDSDGILYQSVCGGCGGSSDFPTTTGAWSITNNSNNCNNLVFKYALEILPNPSFTVSADEGCGSLTVTFTNQSNDTVNYAWDFGPGTTVLSGDVSPTVLYSAPGSYPAVLTIADPACSFSVSHEQVINVFEELMIEISDDTAICPGATFDLVANSFGTANGFTWDDNSNFSSPLSVGAMDSIVSVSPLVATDYYIVITNGNTICDIIDTVHVTTACLGTDELNAYDISVYPNPFTESTTIYFGQVLNGNYSILIYDILGKEVYAKHQVKGSQFEIGRNHLKQGAYIFSIVDSETGLTIYTTKLIAN